MRWLDNNGFPVMRQLLGDQGGEDLAVLRSVPNRDALGVSVLFRLETVKRKPGTANAFSQSEHWRVKRTKPSWKSSSPMASGCSLLRMT